MGNWKKLLRMVGLALAAYVLVSVWVVPMVQKKAPKPVQGTAEQSGSRERVRCIDDNDEALIRRLQLVESAENELRFATYSYKSDESGRDMSAAMLAAADRGVKVRMLVDGLCVMMDLGRSDSFRALAGHPNVEVRVYNPVNLFGLWRLNFRMHDKYLIADDRAYLLGGRNTRNVSLGSYQEKADVDRDVLVCSADEGVGASLGQVRDYFETVWALPTTKPYRSKAGSENALQGLRDWYQTMKTGAPEVFAEPHWEDETVETASVRLLANPPRAGIREPALWSELTGQMQQGSDILIQTPYLILNGTMRDDLARLTEDGKRLRIILNAPETGANPNGCVDYLNQRNRLRKLGGELYEYAGERSAHTKTVLVDDRVSIIGSFNMDMRSAYLDTEMMLVIDCPELNAMLREKDEGYMAHSRCVHPDGEITLGAEWEAPTQPPAQKLLYGLMRVVILPMRHLL